MFCAGLLLSIADLLSGLQTKLQRPVAIATARAMQQHVPGAFPSTSGTRGDYTIGPHILNPHNLRPNSCELRYGELQMFPTWKSRLARFRRFQAATTTDSQPESRFSTCW